MIAWERAQAHERHADRDVRRFGQLPQLLRRVGADDSAADVEEGSFCFRYFLRGLFNLVDMTFEGWFESPNVNSLRKVKDA